MPLVTEASFAIDANVRLEVVTRRIPPMARITRLTLQKTVAPKTQFGTPKRGGNHGDFHS